MSDRQVEMPFMQSFHVSRVIPSAITLHFVILVGCPQGLSHHGRRQARPVRKHVEIEVVLPYRIKRCSTDLSSIRGFPSPDVGTPMNGMNICFAGSCSFAFRATGVAAVEATVAVLEEHTLIMTYRG